jgi:hypothetical protein
MVCRRAFIAKYGLSSFKYRHGIVVFLFVFQAITFSQSLAQQQHFQWQPGQPIDISSLPEEVLNCDECRRRLGLPPLPQASPEKIPAKKGEPKKEDSSKSEPVNVELKKVEIPNVKPSLKLLGEPDSPPAAKPSVPDALRVDGVLTSPATQRIEIEILKRQLQERDVQLKQFGQMQSNVEERIDQLVRMNEDLAKKDAGRQAELDRLQKSSEKTLQARELELSNLRADLATVRADANEKTKRLNDQLLEVENRKSNEIAKLSQELIEAKQSRIDAIANLRKEMAASKEAATTETVRTLAEQAKTLESQQVTIRKLEEQVAKAEQVQREDAERIAKLRKELSTAVDARSKALENVAKRPIPQEIQTAQPSQQTTTAKEPPSVASSKEDPTPAAQAPDKPNEPAIATTKVDATPTNLPPTPAPAESKPTPKRRAF